MRIVLDDLPIGGARFAGTASLPKQRGRDGSGICLPHPVAFGVWAIRDGRVLQVRGWLSTTLEAMCARCAVTFTQPLKRDFEVSYRALDEQASPASKELDERDLALDYYSGDAVDLRQLLAEQVWLAEPMKPLCRSKGGAQFPIGPMVASAARMGGDEGTHEGVEVDPGPEALLLTQISDRPGLRLAERGRASVGRRSRSR